MKKIILILVFTLLIFSSHSAFAIVDCDFSSQSYLNYKINRLVVVNAINLEPQQQKDIAAVFKKYDDTDYSLLKAYNDQKAVLADLKLSKAGFKTVWAQKKAVKLAKKQLNNHYKQVDKEIFNIMSASQKAKYRTISKKFY